MPVFCVITADAAFVGLGEAKVETADELSCDDDAVLFDAADVIFLVGVSVGTAILVGVGAFVKVGTGGCVTSIIVGVPFHLLVATGYV